MDSREDEKVLNPVIWKDPNDDKLNIDKVIAYYFNDDALRVQPNPVYRLNMPDGKHFYYCYGAETNYSVEHYISVSKLLEITQPTPSHLIEWRVKIGNQEAERRMKESANYGTLMHLLIGQYVINKKIDLGTIRNWCHAEITNRGWDYDHIQWGERLKKDISAFAQWVIDYEVEPLAVELMLCSEYSGLSVIVDFVCMMNAAKYTDKTPKSKRKRVRAIVDFKSNFFGQGSKKFYASHEVQLLCSRDCWNENFPELPVVEIANWAPNDWRSKPTYTFQWQTDSDEAEKLPYMVEIAKAELKKLKSKGSIMYVKSIGGVLNWGENTDGCLNVVRVEEFLTSKMMMV